MLNPDTQNKLFIFLTFFCRKEEASIFQKKRMGNTIPQFLCDGDHVGLHNCATQEKSGNTEADAWRLIP